MATREDYEVGQTVLITSVNRREPVEGTVMKVGRLLVTVRSSMYGEQQYRIESGAANDSYGHETVLTYEEYERRERRRALVQRLHELGVGPSNLNRSAFDRYSNETLLAAINVLEGAVDLPGLRDALAYHEEHAADDGPVEVLAPGGWRDVAGYLDVPLAATGAGRTR